MKRILLSLFLLFFLVGIANAGFIETGRAAAGVNSDITSLEGAAGVAPIAVTAFAGTISAATRTATFSSAADWALAKIGSTLIVGADTRIIVAIGASPTVTVDANTTWAGATAITSLQEPIAQMKKADGTVVGYINALGGQGFVGGYGLQKGLVLGDGDSGLVKIVDGIVDMFMGNISRWRFTGDDFHSTVNGGHLRGIAATSTTPSFSPNKSDVNTGLGRAAEDQLSLIAGGVEAIRSIEANSIIYNVMNSVQQDSVTDATSNGTTTISKAGENFTATCVAGDTVLIWDGTTTADYGVYSIASVTDNDNLVLNRAPSGSDADVDFYVFRGGTITTGDELHVGHITASIQKGRRTAVGAADYNPSTLTSDYIIAMTDTAAARAVIISTEDVSTGSATSARKFVIKDESGGAAAQNITVTLESGGTIDGAATYVINQNYQSIDLYINGTNGFVF